MIDPASMGDWIQASAIVGALGGLAAACGWVLRQEELTAGRRVTMERVPVAAGTGPSPSERARRILVGGNRE
jgi:hypothetical protein